MGKQLTIDDILSGNEADIPDELEISDLLDKLASALIDKFDGRVEKTEDDKIKVKPEEKGFLFKIERTNPLIMDENGAEVTGEVNMELTGTLFELGRTFASFLHELDMDEEHKNEVNGDQLLMLITQYYQAIKIGMMKNDTK